MYRDFSEKSKNELLGLVEEVENEKISNFTDWIGDRWYDFESWIGKLNIRNYLNNINEYHKKIVDKNNTTKLQIKIIFRAIAEVDSTYQSKLSDMDYVLQQWLNYIKQLSSIIAPTNGRFNIQYMDINLDIILKNIVAVSLDKNEIMSEDELISRLLKIYKVSSDLLKTIFKNDKDSSNKYGLASTAFSYLGGLHTFQTTQYTDTLDAISGSLDLIKNSGSAWTGIYKYLEKSLNEYQAGRLGKVWQGKVGTVSLISSICGFSKESINTYKILVDENGENYEKVTQILKMTNCGVDVGEAIIKLVWDKKELTGGETVKYQWEVPDKNAEIVSKWGNRIGAIEAYINTVIGAIDKYHEVIQDGNFTMDNIAEVGMAASVKGLASIIATKTGGLSDALFDLSDKSEQIADGIKNIAVDPMAKYVETHPVSHFFIQNTQGLKEFANNEKNNVFARVGASVIAGTGTISSIAIDSVIAPVTTTVNWLSSGWDYLQNMFTR